jgi:hypothetical protein
MCDWIEGSILFEDEELSQIEIADILMEEQIYDEHDFCMEMISSAWSEMKQRQHWIGEESPFSFPSGGITRTCKWTEVPAYSFCLLLSLAAIYRDWARQFGHDYTKQGQFFEELTKESLAYQFKDWVFFPTGWSRERTPKLNKIVKEIARQLGESVGNLPRWTNQDQKEAGLDILCYRPFNDGRVGVPVYLMQCASGGNWQDKLHTPRLELWTHIVDFASKPKKAFAMPFALTNEIFTQKCLLVDGMFIDRYRILSTSEKKQVWLSKKLRCDLINWTRPRIKKLPRRGA